MLAVGFCTLPRRWLLVADFQSIKQCDQHLFFPFMETALQLLMRDGAVRVAFHPRLSSEQYAELMAICQRATTKDELRQEVETAAQRWGSTLDFDTH